MTRPNRRATDEEDSHEFQRRDRGWRFNREINVPTLIVVASIVGGFIKWGYGIELRQELSDSRIQAHAKQQADVDTRQDRDLALTLTTSRQETAGIKAQMDAMNAKLDRIIEERYSRTK